MWPGPDPWPRPRPVPRGPARHDGRPDRSGRNLIAAMASRLRSRYTCPDCGGTTIGWIDDHGIDRWDCWGPLADGHGCGSRRRPAGADLARLPGPTPAAYQRHPKRPRPTPPIAGPLAPAPLAPPVASGSSWRKTAGWVLAIALALLLGASALRLGPFAGASTAPGGEGPAITNSGGPGGPQYNGYVVRCRDGWISHSGGRPGACSHHGGVAP